MLRSFVLNGLPGDTPLDITQFVEITTGIGLEQHFPTATHNAWGQDLMNAGVLPPERAYNDAPWSLTVTPTDFASGSAVSAYLDEVTRRIRPFATFSIAEDDCPAATGTFKEFDQQARQCFDTWGRVTYIGTRWPAWEGRVVPFGPISVPLFGTADLDSTPDGDLEAAVDLFATIGSATTGAWLGVKADPGTGYDPIDDYSGVTDTTCVGGSKSTAHNLTANTQSSVATAPAFDVNDNLGIVEHIARLVGNDATTAIVGASVVTPSIGLPVSAPNPPVALGATVFNVLDLGQLKIPAQDVPNLASGSAYGTPALSANYDGTSTYSGTGGCTTTAFVPAAGRLEKFSVKLGKTTVASGPIMIELLNSSYLPISMQTIDASALAPSGAFYDFTCSVAPSDQTFYITVDLGYVTGSVQVYGGSSPQTHIAYRAYVAPLVTFGATTPVLATTANSSKNVAVDVVTRVPLDDFAMLCRASLAANQGWRVNSFTRTRYLIDSSGNGGASLAGSLDIEGVRPGFAPGVVNRFVAAADTGATLPGTMTVWGTYTERHIDRARAV